MRYLVMYYNGRANREKVFMNIDEAKKFRDTCGDLTATIWKEVTNE